jgi:hypothetical protein
VTSAQAWEVVVETEPEWDEATRDLVVALDDVDLCSVCGGPAYLCQDPEREFDWTIDEPTRCHRTTAIRKAQAALDEETNPHQDALAWRAGLRAPGEDPSDEGDG